jgi:hypothetical protein
MIGEEEPTLRETLKIPIRNINKRILQTPTYDFHDPGYIRIKFLRYADDVILSVIGPKALAKQVQEELANFLKDDLKLELNRDKTQIVHLRSERTRFLGYVIETSTPRLRRRNLRRKRSPHNVVQTVKTTSGNIKLLVPLRDLSEKLKRYMANGQPKGVFLSMKNRLFRKFGDDRGSVGKSLRFDGKIQWSGGDILWNWAGF